MLILLDYPSVDSMKAGVPLAGYPASLFKIAARYADLGAVEFVTLFPHPPRFENPSNYFHKKKEVPDEAAGNPTSKQLGYLKSEFVPHYNRVRDRCRDANFILAMGDLSLWSLTGEKLSDHRGTILYTDDDIRVVATHHPRAIVKDHSLLPVVAMDLKKARQESQKKTSTFPRRTIHIVEDDRDVAEAAQQILKAESFAFDIETANQQITMICFATSPHEVYVFPLVLPFGEATPAKKQAIATLMASPKIKIAHNAVYDLTYLKREGYPINYPVDDTMLLSHSVEIEWPKSLGFLGSIYCNEKSWKLLRVGKVKDRNKKDE